jgi:hypothetical protein
MFQESVQKMLAIAGDFLTFVYKSAPTASFSRGDRYAALEGCGMRLSVFRSGGAFVDLEPDWNVDKGFEEDPNYQDDRARLIGLAREMGASIPPEVEGY